MVQITKEQILTASDGNAYKITVTYDSDAGIPEDAELSVSEFASDSKEYKKYVKKAAKKLDKEVENLTFAHTFDIALVNPESGERYQPAKNVKVSVKLLGEDVEEDSPIDVVHFGDETQVMESSVNGESIEFETDGFSVYVIIEHEGEQTIKTPRVEFHFLSEKFTVSGTSYLAEGYYSFLNKAGTMQTSQILRDGESLEMIANPPNIKVDGKPKYFFGWYVVDYLSSNAAGITYTWPDDPDEISFEAPITINPASNGTAGNDVTWSIGGVTGTAALDLNGTAHVYLAPIYDDYRFVSFHLGTKDSSISDTIMGRKLVVLGKDDLALVRIGDQKAPSPDARHKVFSGWEIYYENGTSRTFTSVRSATGAEKTGTYYAGTGVTYSDPQSSGYYLAVQKSDFPDPNAASAASSGSSSGSSTETDPNLTLHLYPVYDEARWVYYDLGKKNNGATYVPAEYRLTIDLVEANNETLTSEGEEDYYLAKVPEGSQPRRSGYTLEGWYADAVLDEDGNITNLTEEKPVTTKYLDASGNEHEVTENLRATKIANADENSTFADTNYTKTVTDSGTPHKLYEISDGKLKVYKALDDLTLYANWTKNINTTYKVVVWKQKVTDHKDTQDDEKTYDYEDSYTSRSVNSDVSVDPAGFVDSDNITRNLTNLNFTGFHYNATKSDMSGTPKPDNTTVYNIYYDRNLLTINWKSGNNPQQVSGHSYTPTTSNDESPQQYGWVNASYVELTRRENGYQYTYGPAYTASNKQEEVMYGFINGAYVPLTSTPVTQQVEKQVEAYKLTSTLTAGKEYLIVSRNSAGTGYALGNTPGYWYGTIKSDPVTILFGTPPYIKADDDVESTSVWTAANVSGVTFTFKNGSYYLSNSNNNLRAYYDAYYATDWTWSSTYNRLSYGGWNNKTYYILYNNGFSLSTVANSVYLYEKSTVTETTTEVTGYTYSYGSEPYTGKRYLRSDTGVYTGTRYSDAACTTTTNAQTGDQWGKDSNGYIFQLTRNQVYKWTYNDNGTEKTYTGTRFIRDNGNTVTSFTGLYEQPLSMYGYVWPKTVNNTNYSWSYGSGTLTFLDAFLFKNIVDGNTLNLTIQSAQSGGTVYFYKQNLDKSWPDTATNEVSTNGGNFSITDKYTGFSAYQYRKGNETNWTSAGSAPNYASNISTSNNLYIRFQRNSYDFTFDLNYPTGAGITYDGRDTMPANPAPVSKKYEESLSDLAKKYGVDDSETDYKTDLTAPDHYIFEGWYEDKTCTKEFNFNSTMPAANKIVYAKWTPVKFRVTVNPNGAEIDHIDHTGASYDSSVMVFRPGSSSYTDKSTYFNCNYNETISGYETERNYVEITDATAAAMDPNDVYYYLNMQYDAEQDGNGLPSDLRNALYLKESEIHDYYLFHTTALEYYRRTNPEKYGSVPVPLGENAWREKYIGTQKYRRTTGTGAGGTTGEHYTLLGWYKLKADGTPEAMPYNFNDKVTKPVNLKAFWRLDGGYRIRYIPSCYVGTVFVNGDMPSWYDPVDTNATYADDAKTNIYRQPTGITANGSAVTGQDYMFRGWQLVSVRTLGGVEVVTELEPGVYHDPGDPFTISAGYADTSSTIYFRAIYEKKISAYRRPDYAVLTLDANGGYVTEDGSDPASGGKELDWTGSGKAYLDYGREEIAFGFYDSPTSQNMQSNFPVHLYQYATEITYPNGVTPYKDDGAGNQVEDTSKQLNPAGTNYFKHQDGYFLLGFDEDQNKSNFIPTYPADAVVSAQRSDHDKLLYAVWEPMVYLTLRNNTKNDAYGVAGKDLKVSLGPTGSALSVVNTANGLYTRSPVESLGDITVPLNGEVRLAIPRGKNATISISGTNDLGTGTILFWKTTMPGASEQGDPSGQANNLADYSFNETLVENPTGIVVTFTAVKANYTLILDENYPGGHVSEEYFSDKTTDANYVDKQNGYEIPNVSTRPIYQFLGWASTPDATTAEYRPDQMVTPRSFYPDNNVREKTLYGVWKAAEEAHTLYVHKVVPEPGNRQKEFDFTVTANVKYNPNGAEAFDVLATPATKTYHLRHNQYLKLVTEAETGEASSNTKASFRITAEIYNEGESTPVYTATCMTWTNNNNDAGSFKGFSLTVEEADYSNTDYYDTLAECASGGSALTKENDRKVKWSEYGAGATAIFTNTKQTQTLTVKKQVEGPTTDEDFEFTANWTAESGGLTGSESFALANLGTTALTIPRGAEVTIVEKGANLIDYDTTAKKGTDDLTITAGSDNSGTETVYTRTADSVSLTKDATVTFTNTRKSVPVKIVKMGSDGTTFSTDVEALFSMKGSSYLFTDRYTKPVSESVPKGNIVFETGTVLSGNQADQRLYVGDYTLEETKVYGNYMKLSDEIAISVKGTETGATVEVSPTSAASVEPNTDGMWVITVTNRKTALITVNAALNDPLNRQRTFSFTASYTLDDNPIEEQFEITAFHKDDGTVAEGTVPKTLTIPIGATNLTITEDTSGEVAQLYDTSVQYKTEARTPATSYAYSSVFGSANSGDSIVFFNDRKPICKIVDNDTEQKFSTLCSAVTYAETNMSRTATIEMLVDYTMSHKDTVTIAAADNITLTTATTGTYQYSGTGPATITRGFDEQSMFTNEGHLTLASIVLDGDKSHYAGDKGSLVYVKDKASLTINADATLKDAKSDEGGGAVYVGAGTLRVNGTIQDCESTANVGGGAIYADKTGASITVGNTATLTGNHADSGNGGAIFASGTVNVTGGTISGNTAEKGAAIYGDSTSVLNISGGSITGNTASNTSSGAVEGGVINFSGNSNVYDNKNGSNQRNVVLNADSDTVINVTGALSDDDTKKIGVYATQGNRWLSGMDFGSYEGSLTGHLNRFKNDRDETLYGMVDSDNAQKICWVYGTITITKAWKNDDHPDSVTVQLRRGEWKTDMHADTTWGQPFSYIDWSSDALTPIGQTTADIVLDGNNNWSKAVRVPIDSKILSFPAAKNKYSAYSQSYGSNYYVTETKVGDAQYVNSEYTATYSQRQLTNLTPGNAHNLSVTITNRKKQYLAPVVVHKDWSENTPDSYKKPVTLNLYGKLSDSYTEVKNGVNVDSTPGCYIGNSTTPEQWSTLQYLKTKGDGGTYTEYKAEEPNLLTKDNGIWSAESTYTAPEQWVKVTDNTQMTDAYLRLRYTGTVNNGNDNNLNNINKMVFYFKTQDNIWYESTVTPSSTVSLTGGMGAVHYVKLSVPADVSLEDLTLQSPNFIPLGGLSNCYGLKLGAAAPSFSQGTSRANANQFDQVEFMPNANLVEAVESTAFTGTQTLRVLAAKRVVLTNTCDAIARVRNKPTGGSWSDWTYFAYLTTTTVDGNSITGAFNYANGLTGEVEIETLLENHERYTLTDGFTFNKAGITKLTLQTTQEAPWNSGTTKFRSTIQRGSSNTNSLMTSSVTEFNLTRLILDGGSKESTPLSCSGNGGLVNVASGTLNVQNGTTMQNTKATNEGGAIYAGASAGLSVNGTKTGTGTTAKYSVNFTNCEGKFGGAIFHERGALTTSVTGSSFDNCETTSTGNKYGGGAVCTRQKKSEFTDCSFNKCSTLLVTGEQPQGGAILHSGLSGNPIESDDSSTSTDHSSTTIESCIFKDCSSGGAGGAVDAETVEVSVKNSTFTDCESGLGQQKDGGALEASPKDNYNGTHVGSELTVENCIFESSQATRAGGAIRSLMEKNILTDNTFCECETTTTANKKAHGGAVIFLNNTDGAYATVSGCEFLNCEAKGTDMNGGAIYSAVKKLTVQSSENVTGSSKKRASRFINCASNGNGGAIYSKAGSSTNQGTILSDCVFDGHETYVPEHPHEDPEEPLVLADANKNAVNGGAIYIESGPLSITDSVLTDCVASNNGGAVCIKNASINVTLKNVTIDGHDTLAVKYLNANKGGAIFMDDAGNSHPTLYLTDTNQPNTIRNCSATNGGAVYLNKANQANGANMELTDGSIISGNTAKTAGAGIYLTEGTTLKLSGSPNFGGAGTITDNGTEHLLAFKKDKTVTKDVSDGNGGTVTRKYTLYRRYYKTEDGTPVYPDASGATYYTWEEGKLYTTDVGVNSKILVDGNVIPGIGNFTTALTNKKNGGIPYAQTREDIYIAGYAGESSNAVSLVVTGKLTKSNSTDSMDSGSIWVGTQYDAHYKQNMQFATFGGSAVNNGKVKDNVNPENTMKAFRNAYDDETTENGTDSYLYGEAGDGVFINWNGIKGSARVILKKVNGSCAPLSGAKFTVYKKDQSTIVKVKKTEGSTTTEEALKDKTSGTSGVFWIGDLPYGTYYLHETEPENKWFYFVLDENFQSMSDGSTKEATKTAGDAETTAVSWASKIISAKKTYADLPNDSTLKNRVKTLLTDSGHSDLLT